MKLNEEHISPDLVLKKMRNRDLSYAITNLKSEITGLKNEFSNKQELWGILRKYIYTIPQEDSFIKNAERFLIDGLMKKLLFNDDFYKDGDICFDILKKINKILNLLDIKPSNILEPDNYDFYYNEDYSGDTAIVLMHSYNFKGEFLSKGIILYTGDNMSIAIEELMNISRDCGKQLLDFVKKHFPLKKFLKTEQVPVLKEKNANQHLLVMENFIITSSREPIYENINSIDDFKRKISDIISEIDKINVELFIENVSEKNKRNLEALSRAVKKYAKKIEKIEEMKDSDDIVNISDLENLLKNKLIEFTDKFFIKTLMDPIYAALKANVEYNVYKSILKSINKYLSFLGIKTYNELKVGDKMDYDYYNILITEDTNIKELDETIKKIVIYPYILGKEIVSEGQVIIHKYSSEG